MRENILFIYTIFFIYTLQIKQNNQNMYIYQLSKHDYYSVIKMRKIEYL